MSTLRQPIRTTGRILEKTGNGLFKVETPNGYTPEAHLDRAFEGPAGQLKTGNTVLLEFSAYNLSQGRILGILPGSSEASAQDEG